MLFDRNKFPTRRYCHARSTREPSIRYPSVNVVKSLVLLMLHARGHDGKQQPLNAWCKCRRGATILRFKAYVLPWPSRAFSFGEDYSMSTPLRSRQTSSIGVLVKAPPQVYSKQSNYTWKWQHGPAAHCPWLEQAMGLGAGMQRHDGA